MASAPASAPARPASIAAGATHVQTCAPSSLNNGNIFVDYERVYNVHGIAPRCCQLADGNGDRPPGFKVCLCRCFRACRCICGGFACTCVWACDGCVCASAAVPLPPATRRDPVATWRSCHVYSLVTPVTTRTHASHWPCTTSTTIAIAGSDQMRAADLSPLLVLHMLRLATVYVEPHMCSTFPRALCVRVGRSLLPLPAL